MKHLAISVALILGVVFSISQSASAQWEADQRLSTADSGVTLNENMGQCLAASGDSIHVVWSNPHTSFMHIFYRHSFDNGVTWTHDAPIPGTQANASFPSISVSGPNVHVAFRDTTGSNYTTFYVHSTDGGQSWLPPISLGTYYWWPSITSFGNYVYVALNDNHPGNTEVYVRRSTNNGMTWDTVQQISNALGRSEDPSITASGSYVYMAWNDNRTGLMQTWYRRSSDNGVTWGPELQASHAVSFAYFPMIHAVGSNVDIANGERLGSTYQLFFMHSGDFGATWTTEKQLTFGASTSAYPTIARKDQTIDMVYSTFGANASYIGSTDGGVTWSAPEDIAPAANKPGSTFIVRVGTTRHVIWLDNRNGFPAVYYKRSLLPTSANLQSAQIFNFGTLKINLTKDSALELQNVGNAPLNIFGYSMLGAANNFAFVDTSLHMIAAHDSGMIKLRFAPAAAGLDSAILTINSDEGGLASSQIKLIGNGAGPLLTTDPKVLDFGKVDSGKSMSATITLHNPSEVTDTITSIQAIGSREFALGMLQFPIVIPSGGQTTISVTFSPNVSGTALGKLVLALNEGAQTPVQLSGVGVGKVTQAVAASSEILSAMSVSPNPARDVATLHFIATQLLHDVRLNYYDEAGQLIASQTIGEVQSGEQNIHLSLPKMNGAVFLRIVSQSGIVGTANLMLTH